MKFLKKITEIKKVKDTSNAVEQKEPEVSGPSAEIQAIVAEMRRQSATPAYSIQLDHSRKPSLFESKFGGLPYWDLRMDYPSAQTGTPMLLRAKINIADFAAKDPLPETGLLQFFIARDSVCGMDFDAPDQQSTFRVVYHETLDPTVTEEQVSPLFHLPDPEDEDEWDSPIFGEYALTFQEKDVCLTTEDDRFQEAFAQAVAVVCGPEVNATDRYRSGLSKPDREFLWDQLCQGGHWILGYPYFTQSDQPPLPWPGSNSRDRDRAPSPPAPPSWRDPYPLGHTSWCGSHPQSGQ